MDLPTVHMLYNNLAGARLAFLYSGEFRDEHSPRLIELAEATTKSFTGPDPAFAKKLAFILVEAYQNIIRHRAPLTPEVAKGAARSMMMLRSDGRSYEVAAMNAVRPEEVEGLRALLDKIKRNTDLKQLKEMFLKGLQNESSSQRGGAGLGLIEMARRSSSGLEHEIRKVGSGELMFILQLRVGGSSMAGSGLDQIQAMQQNMAQLDALFAFKGEFLPMMQTVLMNMISSDLDGGRKGSDARLRVFLAGLEMIGETKEQVSDPLIVLARSPLGHSMVIGMLLDQRQAKRFGDEVVVLAKMDANSIQRLYRDALLGRNSDGSFASTGLLDLARRSKAPLRMELSPHAGNSLLIIEAVI